MMPVGTDGVRLYFNDVFDQNPLCQAAVSGGVVSRIPLGIPGPTMLGVSPDGSSLLVISDGTGLWSVQVSDGSLRRLTDDDRIRSAVWSPDGMFAVYPTRNGEIKVVRSDGTDLHRLIATEDSTGRFPAYGLRWSPDGRKIRFTLRFKIWEISSEGSNLHPVLPAWRPSLGQCCCTWTPDGRYFMFLSQDSVVGSSMYVPGSQLWILDERRGTLRKASAGPVQLTSGPIRWGRPIPSKDGKKIFARGVVLHDQLVRLDAGSRQLQPYLGGISAEFVTFSPTDNSRHTLLFPKASCGGSTGMEAIPGN